MSVANCPSIQPSAEKYCTWESDWIKEWVRVLVKQWLKVTNCGWMKVWRSERAIDWKVEGKMSFYQYRNSHYKDETVSQLSYSYDGRTYTWKDGLYIEINQIISKRWGGHYINWSSQQNFLCWENDFFILKRSLNLQNYLGLNKHCLLLGNIFKFTCFHENVRITIQISIKFVACGF